MQSTITRDLKLPFDLYDFFGYLFPGAFLGFTAFVLVRLNGSRSPSPDEILSRFEEFEGGLSFGVGLLLLFISLVLFYILGHVVGSIGSLFFEKYLIKGLCGYPSEYYLRTKNLNEYLVSELFYRWGFLAIILTVLTGLLDLSGFPFQRAFEILVWSLLAMVVIRSIMIGLREFVYNRCKVSSKNWAKHLVSSWNWSHDFVVAALKYPTKIAFEWPFRVFFGSSGVLDPFSRGFIERFGDKFQREFGLDYKKAKTNVFWLCYVSLLKNFPASEPIIRNFLHMYSFSRNTAAACFLLVTMQLTLTHFFGLELPIENVKYVVAINWGLFLLGLLLLFRYFYIYSSYYTKFLLRAYILVDDKD